MMDHHHVKYKEIHGVDEVVLMERGEHRRLHVRLRREGKCNIPAPDLEKISQAARIRLKLDTSFRVSPDTRDKLIAMGKKGESYDTLIARLIEHYKKHQMIEAGSTRAEK